MIKRILRFLTEYIKKYFFGKSQHLPDDLLPVVESAERLVNVLELEYEKNVEGIFEYAKALEYSRIIRGNIKRMTKTTEVRLFLISYEDALWFADAICSMESICARCSQKAAEVKEHLKNMQKIKTFDVPTEVVLCSVVFGRNAKHYHYLAPKNKFTKGEYVKAPVGDSMTEKIARIVKITNIEDGKIYTPEYKFKYLTKNALVECHKATLGCLTVNEKNGIINSNVNG